MLLEDEVMVMYSEDQAACFHAVLVPEAWRGFFVLAKEVDGAALGCAPGSRVRPRFRTCPMGWAQAVDFIQEAHERLAFGGEAPAASLGQDRAFSLGSPAPDFSSLAGSRTGSRCTWIAGTRARSSRRRTCRAS